MKRFLLVTGLAACAPHPIEGTPDDVQTLPGAFEGYRFMRPCTNDWIPQAVIGDGAMVIGGEVPGLARDRELETYGSWLYDDLASKVPSLFFGGGSSLPCDDGTHGATMLRLWDWRDVDVTVQLAGAWLSERDLGLEVGIHVTQPDGM